VSTRSRKDTRDVPRAEPSGDVLLDVRGLRKQFPIRRGVFGRTRAHAVAVDDVSFVVRRGETLGLVGESGSGKTTTGRSVLRLIEPDAGEAWFEGRDIFRMEAAELQRLRRKAQYIFQDPFGSLDPRMTVEDALREVLHVHRLASGAPAGRRVMELLELVGLDASLASRYPHEFSGGQRQRIGIARALSVEPVFMVCDEPVSALDVSIQAQVLNLLRGLQQQLGLTYLFIAHDLGVIEHVSDRIAVMVLGRIVEHGTAADVISLPRHPYTTALLSAVPLPEPRPGRARQRGTSRAEVADIPIAGAGCPYRNRCTHPDRDATCTQLVPLLAEKAPGHFAACHKGPARAARSPGA